LRARVANDVVTAGWVAAGMAFMAAVWFLWSNSLTLIPAGLVALVEVALIVAAVRLIQKGKILRERFPVESGWRDDDSRSFYIVFGTEFILIFVLDMIAINVLHRPDLVPFFTSIVVGAHFVPLARIFHTPSHALFGTAIVVWCVICWFAFPAEIGEYSCLGTGVILWGLSLSLLWRGRRDAQSIEARS
jgi:hypothetical protein